MFETFTGRRGRRSGEARATPTDDAEATSETRATDDPTAPEPAWADTLAGMGTVDGPEEETPAWLTALAAAGGIVVGVGVGVSSWWQLDAGWVGSMVLGLGLLVALAFALRAGERLGVRGRF